MERIGSKTVFEGHIARCAIDEFRYDDGDRPEREIVGHPGAVAIVAHDDLHVYLVRQPREAVGERPLLELPAGKLDVPGESPLDCAKRELAEEIGMARLGVEGAEALLHEPRLRGGGGHRLSSPPGCTTRAPSPTRRSASRSCAWPLADLDGAIEECRDAKSLIGLLLFRELRRS